MILQYITYFIILLIIINFLGILFLGVLRIYFIKRTTIIKHSTLEGNEPFVSIHFAICNEPPEMVLETLNSFLQLNYKNFEVIIISNNTNNIESWKPIENFSNEINNFKFYHFDNVKGFKAGALNIALEKMSHRANFIFTVDSDYQLHPDALKIAVGSLQFRHVDLLQFPQDYRNVCGHTQGLQINYKHYFECYLSAMDSEKYGLPTGTLTLIKSDIFRNGMKWPTTTITEDAHFGLELLSKGLKIGYCNTSIGLGTMPTNIADYNKQFERWIFGNFQTLMLSFKKRGINFHHKLRLFTMLSAWVNLLAIPIVLTFLAVPLYFLEQENISFIYALIILSISTHLLVQIFLFTITSKNNKQKTLKALLVHIGTIEIGSFHWMSYFRKSEKPFVRTNKYLNSNSDSWVFFAMPILLFLCSILYLLTGFKIVGLALLGIAVIAIIGKLQLMYELFHSKFNLSKGTPL